MHTVQCEWREERGERREESGEWRVESGEELCCVPRESLGCGMLQIADRRR